MFSKLAVFFIAAAALVSAVPTPGDEPAAGYAPNTTVNKCNVGTLQCCKSVQKADSAAAQKQAGILGVALGGITGIIGLECSPISAVVGIGAGANCNGTPVCCESNHFKGLIAGGCGPLNINA